MTEGRAQRLAWGEERVARELEAWFAERGLTSGRLPHVRPRRSQAAAPEVIRCGGSARWALELGVPRIVQPRGPGLSDEEIAAALRTLLREHRPERFPTSRWLARHGPPGLAAAVRRTGGGTRWSQALGMPAPQPARWTDELIEAELRRVGAGATRWPSRAEFQAAGATGVLRAVYRGHGSRWWAERLGLSTEGLRTRRSVAQRSRHPYRRAPRVSPPPSSSARGQGW